MTAKLRPDKAYNEVELLIPDDDMNLSPETGSINKFASNIPCQASDTFLSRHSMIQSEADAVPAI